MSSISSSQVLEQFWLGTFPDATESLYKSQ